MWRDIPRASTERCFEGRQGSSPQACARTGGQADDGQATSEAGTGSDRGCRRRGTYLDRSVRYLGRLHGDAERQEGLLCAGEAGVIQNQSADRPRDPAYAFVSSRPAEKVVNEVSIMIGYALKPGSESSLEVGGASFAMYTQGDGLWIKNAAEEEQMVSAMRKSAEATVKGVSAKGTETTDVFSLKGLSQALDRLAQDCKR